MPPSTRPLEEILPRAARDALRETELGRLGYYNPWLHLAVTTVSGLGLSLVGLWIIHAPRWYELCFGLAVAVVANATEWRAHRDILHKRWRPLAVLYDRHTPVHHMIFVTEDMPIRSTRDFALVLIPAYGIATIAVATVPITALLWSVGQRNLAGVFLVVTMLYVTSYEWFHLAWHLPADSRVYRLGWLRALSRTHAVHHDPRLMQRYNFNVMLPLWDLVRGTWVRSLEEGLARRAARRSAREHAAAAASDF